MNIREFIKGMLSPKASLAAYYEYKESFPSKQKKYFDEIKKIIDEAVSEKNAELLEGALTVASLDGLNKRYTDIFCYLLKEKWHHSHEDLVMYLKDIKDPASVECVYNASFIYLDYDDGRSLQKKCIWALGAIDTPEAIQKLILLSQSEDPIVKENAVIQLKQMLR